MVSKQLIYGSTPIRTRGDMVCLTDMWRASGSHDNQRPVIWLRQDGPREFISYIAGEFKVTEDHLVVTERGGRDPATWAHWQIGLAYAKYLSPEFHKWCNEVVRAHMELTKIAPPAVASLDHLFEPIHRGMTEIRTEMRAGFKRLGDNVVELVAKGRKNADAETVRVHGKVVRYHYDGKCPCLECNTTIMDGDGFIPEIWHHHHQFNRNDNRPTAMIPLALACHRRIESDADARTRFGAKAWVLFQTLLERLPQVQMKLDI